MNKLIGFALFLYLALFLGCSSGTGKTLRYDPKFDSMKCASGQLAVPIRKRRGSSSSSKEFKYKIRGIVEVNEKGNVYVVEKWESRSRKSYLVTGKLTEAVAALKGKVVVVNCCFLTRSTWSGTIRVFKVVE